jgi:hypothetical protein
VALAATVVGVNSALMRGMAPVTVNVCVVTAFFRPPAVPLMLPPVTW